MTLNNLEQHAINNFFEGTSLPDHLEDTPENIAVVGIMTALEVGRLLQKTRLFQDESIVSYKPDGTRVTPCDIEGEQMARNKIAKIFPNHHFIGEEGGGIVDPTRHTWIIDPIDSTNAFVSHENTSAVSICVMHEGKAVFSTIYNPFTSELYYATGSDSSRLIRSYGFQSEYAAHTLPLASAEPNSHVRFVNVHPTAANDEALQLMIAARTRHELQKVLQQGGSPSFNLVSITKGGHFGVVHQWDDVAKPWDLAAAVHIVKNSGGRITDLNNSEIPSIGHSGMLVATMDEAFQKALLTILRS